MLLNSEQFRFERKEYERRVDTLLMERAVREARAARTQAMTQLVDQSFRLVASLVAKIWGWRQGTLQSINELS
jgi:hypothetical protein